MITEREAYSQIDGVVIYQIFSDNETTFFSLRLCKMSTQISISACLPDYKVTVEALWYRI